MINYFNAILGFKKGGDVEQISVLRIVQILRKYYNLLNRIVLENEGALLDA